MRKITIALIIVALLQSCCLKKTDNTIAYIYKIADHTNSWCYYIGGNLYNSFQDSTLYIDNMYKIHSLYRPNLHEENCQKKEICTELELCFDSLWFSNECSAKYCMVYDAVIKEDSCRVYVHNPVEKKGLYTFALTCLELSFINTILLDLPKTNYVELNNLEDELSPRLSLLRIYSGHGTTHIFVDMLSDNINTNVALCMDVLESIANWHINDLKESYNSFIISEYRKDYNEFLKHYNYCDESSTPME